MLYDLFICHASEDKTSFVRPLADKLREENIAVWYDEFSLTWGDSIRQALDKGLRQSRFGAVVLSDAFFRKGWTQYELDGLTEREIKSRTIVILPIWHGVTHEEVLAYSPSLAGRKAVSSSEGLEAIVSAVCETLRPEGSPLIIARDFLLEWGCTPPVVTDKYWLNVVEASNRVPGYGAHVPEASAWNRWSFPLPAKEASPRAWGERLAWTAMQLDWVEAADRESISPLTPSEDVLVFIDSHPGLFETCRTFVELLIEYAPQLSIRGMGGDLEDAIEDRYQRSLAEFAQQRSQSATATNGEGRRPLCDADWALRHPTFGGHDARKVAHAYFSGGMFGPSVSPFEHADHAIWLLSSASHWLPAPVHRVLLDGIKKSHLWPWHGYGSSSQSGVWKSGALFEKLSAGGDPKKFRWNRRIEADVMNRIRLSTEELGLPDAPEELVRRFREEKFPQAYLESEKELRRRRERQSARTRSHKRAPRKGRSAEDANTKK